MAKLTDTLDTDFIPEVGEFLVETFGGIRLLRKNAADSSRWSQVAEFSSLGGQYPPAVSISNPVAGAIYRFEATQPNSAARADQ